MNKFRRRQEALVVFAFLAMMLVQFGVGHKSQLNGKNGRWSASTFSSPAATSAKLPEQFTAGTPMTPWLSGHQKDDGRLAAAPNNKEQRQPTPSTSDLAKQKAVIERRMANNQAIAQSAADVRSWGSPIGTLDFATSSILKGPLAVRPDREQYAMARRLIAGSLDRSLSAEDFTSMIAGLHPILLHAAVYYIRAREMAAGQGMRGSFFNNVRGANTSQLSMYIFTVLKDPRMLAVASIEAFHAAYLSGGAAERRLAAASADEILNFPLFDTGA